MSAAVAPESSAAAPIKGNGVVEEGEEVGRDAQAAEHDRIYRAFTSPVCDWLAPLSLLPVRPYRASDSTRRLTLMLCIALTVLAVCSNAYVCFGAPRREFFQGSEPARLLHFTAFNVITWGLWGSRNVWFSSTRRRAISAAANMGSSADATRYTLFARPATFLFVGLGLVPCFVHPMMSVADTGGSRWRTEATGGEVAFLAIAALVSVLPTFAFLFLTFNVALFQLQLLAVEVSTVRGWWKEIDAVREAVRTKGGSVLGASRAGSEDLGSPELRANRSANNLSGHFNSNNRAASRYDSRESANTVLIDRWKIVVMVRDDVLLVRSLVRGTNRTVGIHTSASLIFVALAAANLVATFTTSFHTPAGEAMSPGLVDSLFSVTLVVMVGGLASVLAYPYLNRIVDRHSTEALKVIDALCFAGGSDGAHLDTGALRGIGPARSSAKDNASVRSEGDPAFSAAGAAAVGVVFAPFDAANLAPLTALLTARDVGMTLFGDLRVTPAVPALIAFTIIVSLGVRLYFDV